MWKLIVHGGAGAREGSHADFEDYASRLRAVVERSYPQLRQHGARAAVVCAIRLLEDDPVFNAGTGSRLQRDGKARMSAALMSSDDHFFSGVINVQNIANPIEIANLLRREKHKVLAGRGARRYARSLGVSRHDPVTPHRLKEHRRRKTGVSGTVGAVALDEDSIICAGTSTGGVGYEIPGRVSDSATVAGTYAGRSVGVSCTGIGEHIVNHAAAVRLVTRVEDGSSLEAASKRTLAEASAAGYRYGLIALDAGGHLFAGGTEGVTTVYASHDGERLTTFLDES